jgi:DnaJ-class molecular chaperone
MNFPVCEQCGGSGLLGGPGRSAQARVYTLEDLCPACEGSGVIMTERDRQALAEDEADMTRIAREWRDFDTDPPGS